MMIRLRKPAEPTAESVTKKLIKSWLGPFKFLANGLSSFLTPNPTQILVVTAAPYAVRSPLVSKLLDAFLFA